MLLKQILMYVICHLFVMVGVMLMVFGLFWKGNPYAFLITPSVLGMPEDVFDDVCLYIIGIGIYLILVGALGIYGSRKKYYLLAFSAILSLSAILEIMIIIVLYFMDSFSMPYIETQIKTKFCRYDGLSHGYQSRLLSADSYVNILFRIAYANQKGRGNSMDCFFMFNYFLNSTIIFVLITTVFIQYTGIWCSVCLYQKARGKGAVSIASTLSSVDNLNFGDRYNTVQMLDYRRS